MKSEKWRFERSTMTVRDEANHCLFSAKTFASGGTFDAARSADAERLLALAAAAPGLLEALENMVSCFKSNDSDSMANAVEDASSAITKAKGGAL